MKSSHMHIYMYMHTWTIAYTRVLLFTTHMHTLGGCYSVSIQSAHIIHTCTSLIIPGVYERM